ncbi:hypothetical protein SAMN04515667_1025 [Formosa sp. Hel1_31_208]|uniref:cupin domain-containing protein n=1 Tax=Formosa sp. Hel1_31_208 TaxID=1798225 RepID=UPI00087A3D65|nr:cupin domain-containing protein [Formosa sp. Hel1_31_208]SDR93370.1 hypothetical protein SAMN04515667_1025 [Formosa sp. Hel1_31_208]
MEIKLLFTKFYERLNHLTAKNRAAKFVTFSLFTLLIVSCHNKSSSPDPLQAGWNDEAVCEVVNDNDELRVLKCTFAPGIGHERHYHKPHIGYAISGSTFRIKDTTGVRTVKVPSGYSFENEGIDWHEVLNIGDSTAVFLIMEYK